jgi:hypothetical protein
VAGRLVDSQRDTGGTPLWNIVHGDTVPIRGSTLKHTQPGADGAFAFGHVPDGIYVLHVEGGRSSRSFDGTDKLVRVIATASRDTLVLTNEDPGGGSCGGISLEVLKTK